MAIYDNTIQQIAREDERAQQLMKLSGIGAMTASAIVAAVGNAHDFKSFRQFNAWLGLTPGQYGSGGKARLGSITKTGDSYIRSLLALGARAVLLRAKPKTDPVSRWAVQLKERRGYWRAIVTIAAKNARMCWAALKLGDSFRVPA